MNEQWKDIPGYEGRYQVSDLGRVRSLDHYVRLVTRQAGETRRLAPGKILRPGRSGPFGHVTVALGKGNSRPVHSLVALAFIGPRPDGHDVAHLNGDGGDNRLENLAYATRSDNNKHMVHHGRRQLSVTQVRAIREKAARGFAYGEKAALARQLGVSQSFFGDVVSGKSYGHV